MRQSLPASWINWKSHLGRCGSSQGVGRRPLVFHLPHSPRHLALILENFQVGAVAKCPGFGSYRVELAVSFISRVVDPENMEVALLFDAFPPPPSSVR
jgi:hypothetical protein